MGGDLPMNIFWKHNNVSIDKLVDVNIIIISKRVNVLSIDAVSGHHAGNYTCQAENKAGVAMHSAHLIVNGLFFEKLIILYP